MSTVPRIGTVALLLAATVPAAVFAAGSGGLDEAIAAYERAQMSGDRQALSRLLADDYLLVNSSGAHEDKAAFIADLTDPAFKLDPYVVQAPARRVWAEGAVVAGVARQAGSQAGKRFDGCIGFADVWKHVGGSWRVAVTHVSRLPLPGASGCRAD